MTTIRNCNLSRAPVVSIITVRTLLGKHCETFSLVVHAAQSSCHAAPGAGSLGHIVNGRML
jgi:hypothetical protein